MKQQMQKQSIFEYGREKIGCFYLAIFLIFLSTIANLAAYYFGYKIIILLIARESDYRPILQNGLYLFVAKALNGILLSSGLRHVILHELVHLLEANHSQRFYTRLRQIDPAMTQAEALLKTSAYDFAAIAALLDSTLS